MKVLVINPGATSTKVALFEEQEELLKENILHTEEELSGFHSVMEQKEYRLEKIRAILQKDGICLSEIDAVCGRGGLLRHIPSGTYEVNAEMLEDVVHPVYGEHASNLGPVLARQLADENGVPAYIVDPVCVDELTEVARVSGLKGMERESFFHALNQKAMAKKAADMLHRPYEELNLIVVHLGGGVSVAAHEQGLCVDNYNVKDEGAMGLDRGGSLPVNALINLCFSGKSKQEVKKMTGQKAGIYSYLGTKDFREVERRAFSGKDEEANKIYRAFVYQLAKDIGAMAAVLKFRVDAVIYTGGIAHSKIFCEELSSYVRELAPVIILPGEEEMKALADGALRVLHGEEAKKYTFVREEKQ